MGTAVFAAFEDKIGLVALLLPVLVEPTSGARPQIGIEENFSRGKPGFRRPTSPESRRKGVDKRQSTAATALLDRKEEERYAQCQIIALVKLHTNTWINQHIDSVNGYTTA